MYRSPTFKLVLAALVLVFATGSYAVAYKEVTVVDGNSRTVVSTFARNVQQVLDQNEIHLGPHDAVDPGMDASIQDGCTVRVLRAFTVKVVADGKEKSIQTTEKTVGDILQEAEIAVKDQDIVKPEIDMVVDGETVVTVQRVSFKEVVEKKEIPYETVRRPDNSLNKGTRRILQEGRKGIEKSTYMVKYVDGKFTDSKRLERVIVREPQPRIVAEGTLQLASRGGKNFRFDRAIRAVATAYTYTGNRTSTGTKPGPGTIAVDPRVIPLGTRLYVDGYGYGVARDTGGAIKGNKIDVFFTSEAACRKWGRRTVNVFVIN